MKRIKKRGRVEELTIGYEYIEKINRYHESWLCGDKPNVLISESDFINYNIISINYTILHISCFTL